MNLYKESLQDIDDEFLSKETKWMKYEYKGIKDEISRLIKIRDGVNNKIIKLYKELK